jgi:hypothetical protein
MAHKVRKPNAVERNRAKRKADQARRVANSKRENARGGESKSSFGISGAGGNRAALQSQGSPEAQNATSRPLTNAERRFGANVTVGPSNGESPITSTSPTRANAAKIQLQSNALPGSEGGFSSEPPDLTPASFGEPSQGSVRTISSAIQNLDAEARANVDPRLVAGVDALETVGTVAGLAVPGPGGKASGIKKVTSVGIGERALLRAKEDWATGVTQWVKKTTKPAPLPGPGTVTNTAKAKSTQELVPVNTKTVTKVNDYIKRLLLEGKQVIDPVTGEIVLKNGLRVSSTSMFVVAGVVLANKAFGMFLGKEEAPQATGFAASLALMNGRPDLALEGVAMTRDITGDDTLIQKFFSWLGPAAIMNSITDKYIPAVNFEMDIIEQLALDMQAQQEQGLSDADIYEARRIQSLKDKQALQDESIANSILLIRLKEEAAIRGDERAVAYWTEQQARSLQFEQDKLDLKQKYDDAYFKKSQEIRNNAAPSKLNFGLI